MLTAITLWTAEEADNGNLAAAQGLTWQGYDAHQTRAINHLFRKQCELDEVFGHLVVRSEDILKVLQHLTFKCTRAMRQLYVLGPMPGNFSRSDN